MKRTMRLLTTVFLLLAAVSLAAQNAPVQSGERPGLAVVPFSGGEGDDGETIAELFSGDKELARVFRIYLRTGITFGMAEERNVQKYVVSNEEYRNQLLAMGINYVVAGDITRLGEQSLLVISIIDIKKLVQIAGDVQIFANKREIEGKLPGMVRNIIDGAKVNWTDKPMLAVVNPRLSDNADSKASNVLGEILGIEITRTGKYAVYPRNESLDAVQAEWDNQRGATAVADPRGPGNADRPGQVLSVIARGGEGSVTETRFNASIINLDTGEQVSFTTQTYQSIEDGIAVMRTIARELTITETERETQMIASAQGALNSAKERLDGIDGKNRRQFSADYKKAEAAYFQGETAFNEGEYEAVQKNIENMDAALRTLAQNLNILTQKKRQKIIFGSGASLGIESIILDSEFEKEYGLETKDDSSLSYIGSFHWAYNFVSFMAIEAGLNFIIANGGTIIDNGDYVPAYNNTRDTFSYYSMEIPFLLRFNFRPGSYLLSLSAGPYLSIPLGNLQVNHNSDDVEITSSSIWGIMAGASIGYKIGSGYIKAHFSYMDDLKPVSVLVKTSEWGGGEDVNMFRRRLISFGLFYEVWF